MKLLHVLLIRNLRKPSRLQVRSSSTTVSRQNRRRVPEVINQFPLVPARPRVLAWVLALKISREGYAEVKEREPTYATYLKRKSPSSRQALNPQKSPSIHTDVSKNGYDIHQEANRRVSSIRMKIPYSTETRQSSLTIVIAPPAEETPETSVPTLRSTSMRR